MKSLGRILAVARKEFLEAVSTPFLFLIETLFVGLAGYFFYLGLDYYSQVSEEWLKNPGLQREVLNVTTFLLPPLLSNYSLLFLVFVPLITMGRFSNEKKEGTLELLFTFPIRDFEIVLGKWLGTSLILACLLLPLWIYPLVFHYLGGPIVLETYAAGFIGLCLLAFLFTSIGLFISSLFESQTASAVLTAGVLVFFWSLENIEGMSAKILGHTLDQLSIQKYFQVFTRGLISTDGLLFFAAGILLFLFLTLRSLEKRAFRRMS